MPPRPFVNDALWRCLCPGFPANATALPITRAGATTTINTRPKRNSSHCQARPYSAAASAAAASPFFTQPHVPPQTSKPIYYGHDTREKHALVHLPTHVLYENLRFEGSRGHYDDVMRICNVLVKDRGQRPDREMYAAILHSFTSSTDGTAGKVRKVLEEMGFWADGADASAEGRVELDVRGCENALEALAVHPDYLLRAEILEYMKEKWFTLSDRGHNLVVAGLLRDRLFEQALEMLEDMCAKKVRVQEWVFSEAMWTLLAYGEVEEAFYVLGLKETALSPVGAAPGAKLSNALWGAMLDAAAKQQLPGYLRPPTGTCLSILSLAARHGDVQLATDVFRLLTDRETVFNTHHYELLIATYLKANALSDALSIILIMTDANLKVDTGTCIPLYSYLRNTSPPLSSDQPIDMPTHAFVLLQELAAQNRKVPIAAVNTCISAAVSLSLLPTAIEIYKALHSVCPSGPNTETFNLLFRGCSASARKDLAMYLASEMISLNLQPDRITYDRLILVCLQSEDVDDAMGYFEEMRATGMRPRRGTYEELVRQLTDKSDARCVALLKDYKESGEMVSKGAEKRVRDKFEIEE
ncbi:hypothetical protein N0V94_002811 [Neodidymelliopsis sp. IMI 364377]|nr:hypothetical protein N0V94_002811 [Neodidymelliopsis sp. IMI 364377]